MLNIKNYTKKISGIMLSLMIVIMSISFPISTEADSVSNIEFYYLYQNEGGIYEPVFANPFGNIQNGRITLATSSDAVMRDIPVPEGKKLCAWRLAKVEPDMFALHRDSNPHISTPSNAATPSEATPSEPSEPVITFSDYIFKAGQTVDMRRYRDWINPVDQVAFSPVFRNLYLDNPEEGFEHPWRINPEEVTYELHFDRAVNIEYSLYPDFSDMQRMEDTSTPRITLRRPAYGSVENLYIRAYYICAYCDERIELREPLVIALPAMDRPNRDTGHSSGGGTIQTPPPADNHLQEGNNSGGRGSAEQKNANNKADAKKEFLVTATPAPADGWYRSLPQIQVESEPSDTVYYKIWNTSRGETETSAFPRRYEGGGLPFTEDGVYNVRFWRSSTVEDTATDKVFRFEFKLDRLIPKISVNYDGNDTSDNAYYRTGKTATIIIQEANFAKELVNVWIERKIGLNTERLAISEWRSVGDMHTATVAFSRDGDYTLRIEAKDLSGRQAEDFRDAFIIDSQTPLLTISGVSNLSANAEAVKPVIKFSDSNIDMERTEIFLEAVTAKKMESLKEQAVLNRDTYSINMKALDIDDNYILYAKIYDKAGNVSEQKLSFSVNIKGATFVFLPKEYVGKYVNTPFYPGIEIWNTDEVTIVSATVNGKDAAYKYEDGVLEFLEKIEKDGKYTVNLEVSDTAGNISTMQPVEFYFDSTIPINIVTGVESGKTYNSTVKMNIYTENPLDEIKRIVLNGKEITDYKQNDDTKVIEFSVDEEGEYVLEVISEDQAGNLSDMQPIEFTIDYSNLNGSEVTKMETGPNRRTWYLLLIPISILAVSIFGIALKMRK